MGDSADWLVRRQLYPAPLITAPGVLVIDIPAPHRGGGLALGRYYPIIIETDLERDEIERFITEEGATPRTPDILDRRRSSLRTKSVMIARYQPPAPDWPWVSVTCWPQDFVDAAQQHRIAMARGCYTMELFGHAHELDAHHEWMLEGLRANQAISVSMLSADMMPPGGQA